MTHDHGRLSGKIALITGSTSGIGLAIARRFATEGATVLLHGFAETESIQTYEAELSELANSPAKHIAADLTVPDQIEALYKQVEDVYGRLDILVNNAGIQHVAPIEAFPPSKWDAILATNLSAAFHTIRLALPLMHRHHWGRIINIASVSGLIAAPGKSAYTAAKHGLIGLTKAVALETAATPITCNAICPGWVLTPLAEKQIQDRMLREKIDYGEATKRLLVKQPSQAFVSLEQIAALAMYFASEDSAQTRGVAWNIDGGYTAA